MKGTTPGSSEIVQVEGGHIIRPTSRKDRHSKVYTSKGPRDRRVRLAAHTAIQFYDVQDRLGYDRPSKAVDWLINKAQTAIQNLTDSNPSSHPDSTFVGDHHQPDSHFVKSFFPPATFTGDDSVSFDLGLSLHSFQEGFHGWNNGTDMDSRVGFGMSSPFSNLAWNHQRPPLAFNTDEHNSKSWDFQTPIEVGFRVPTRIYGEEEAINHR